MSCNNPMTVTHYGKEFQVPCRWCMGCRTDRISELSTRTRYEIAYLAKKNKVGSSFITCTYNDRALFDDEDLRHEHMIEHLQRIPYDVPYNPLSLYPNDFQKLIKKLRYYLKKQYPVLEKDFKYLWCGEYGDEKMRCHFHAILCGLPTSIIRDFLRRSWCKYGFVTVDVATPTRINYCLEYIEKQVHGDEEYKTFYEQGKIPPFVHTSKGLGDRYWNSHLDELKQTDGLINNGGRFVPVSKYFAKKYGFDLFDYMQRANAKAIMKYELANAKHIVKRPQFEAQQRYAREKELISKARHQGITPPTAQIFNITHSMDVMSGSDLANIDSLAEKALNISARK